ncbi:MAG: hypothetical protein RLZZ430_1632 [Cyanobacteriota bacterium]|jgi:hypothetical protein
MLGAIRVDGLLLASAGSEFSEFAGKLAPEFLP